MRGASEQRAVAHGIRARLGTCYSGESSLWARRRAAAGRLPDRDYDRVADADPRLRRLAGGLLAVWLALLLLAGCSWLPRAGPTGSEVEAQAATGDQVSFDIVKVDDAVIKVLRAQGEPGFPERFKK